MRGSSPNRPSQACGQIAAARPTASAQAEGERAAGERDAQRALPLAGADVGADQRHQRRAEAEHQRDQQVFQPRAGAVAGDRVRAGRGTPTSAVVSATVSVVCRVLIEPTRADAQDVGEQRPAQPRADAAAPRCGRERMYQASTAAVSAVVRHGRRRRRRCRAPGSGRSRRSAAATAAPAATTPTQTASDGTSMLPVPRMTLASAFISQTSTVPANTTFE